jgi:tartrate-resistant acid phosphatase type 5
MRRRCTLLLLFLALPLRAADWVSDLCPALAVAPLGEMEPLIAKATDLPVRILAFGDFGDGGPTQMELARAMAEYDRRLPFDLGITLGDNFYETGLNSPTHHRWVSDWETPYSPLGIRFYATLGNHDYADALSPGAEMERSRLSASWCLPRPYYTFAAGPVQLFAIDTDPIRRHDGATTEEQKRWLDRALAASTAPWKVVYGHHPIYSNGQHGDTPEMIAEILPLLQKHKVDVYLAGHEHDLQALRPEEGVYFFVSGAGGHGLRDVTSRTTCREWALGRFAGFTVLEATAAEMKVLFVGSDAQVVKGFNLKKGVPAMPECPR